MHPDESIIDCYKQAFIDRLRQLRNEHAISAREMSISLGQNVNYINLIENGKRLPSLQGFFAICDYLHILPADFFTAESAHTEAAPRTLATELDSLSEVQKASILSLIQAFRT